MKKGQNSKKISQTNTSQCAKCFTENWHRFEPRENGRAISDLRRLSGVQSCCDLMELMLRWQHIAPTCPDTLDGFPFDARDPFILDENFPHVMVAGNQPLPESRWTRNQNGEQCLLISVPRFSKTQLLALLDLDTMSVFYEHFCIA
ncbi:hypothetical protein DICVIV_09106 [Dictyocaulus viviparus]|uniref:DNA polymerase alpha/delta/epsilon subunit B domain-containing protein n=1 Tax=Dictyocaulus viviparus TaxID=29172 RepID=A0A0D8XR69_DICVI|nr:hypothetical protein DICVIV_09106 [Dictyocaulus viviparus]